MSALRIVPLLKKTSTFSVKDSAKTLLNMSRQTGFTADNANVGKTFQTTKVMLNEVKHDSNIDSLLMLSMTGSVNKYIVTHFYVKGTIKKHHNS